MSGDADLKPPVRGMSVPEETAEWYWQKFERRRKDNT